MQLQVGLDFGIRDYSAVCVNHGSACAGELTFLRSEVSNLVLVIGIHTDGKHLRLPLTSCTRRRPRYNRTPAHPRQDVHRSDRPDGRIPL